MTEWADERAQARDFLATRRAQITPARAGLPVGNVERRVAGLRRVEVASLAGVGVEYYARLERGNLRGVSDTVLNALAQALNLDDAERGHLFDLARAANAATTQQRGRTTRCKRDPVRSSVRAVLTGMTQTPAYVRNTRLDILAANDMCAALYDGILAAEALPVNLARFVFLDQRAEEFFDDWNAMADEVVSTLRLAVGRTPADRALSDLVGELSIRSDEFAGLWARHNVRLHNTARKRLHNSVVVAIEVTGDAPHLPGDDLVIIAYSAAPGSPAAEKLSILASWATQHTPAGAAVADAASCDGARGSDPD